MKSSYNSKRTVQRFQIFAFAAFVFVTAIVASYFGMLDAAHKDASEELKTDLKSTFSVLEEEINVQKTVLQNIAGTDAFQSLLRGEENLESKEEVTRAYSAVKAVSENSRSYILFRESGLCIDSNGAAWNYKSAYSNTWCLFVNGEEFYVDAALGQIFMRKHEAGFEGIYAYHDLTVSEEYELVYMQPIFISDAGIADAVLLVCYDADAIFKSIRSVKNADNLLAEAGGKSVYSKNSVEKGDSYDFCFEYSPLGLKVYYNISGKYAVSRLKPFNAFGILCIIVFLIVGSFITVGVSAAENRHIRKIADLTGLTADSGYENSTDMYEHIEYLYGKMGSRLLSAETKIKDLLLTKMLAFELTDDEIDKISSYVEIPCMMVVLKNYSRKHKVWKPSVEEYISDNNIELFQKIEVSENETVLFFERSAEKTFGDIPVDINKKCRADIRGVYARLNDFKEVLGLYKNMKRLIRYLEYGRMCSVDDADTENKANEACEPDIRSKQLYEIIRSGNAFEAKRIVYEQWYNMSRSPCGNNGIEHLYYAQTSVISQLSADLNLNIRMPEFDSGKDIVTLAFEVTECIEEISEKLKLGGKKNSVKGNQIADYIKQRYTDSAFYMPELVGRFEMSDRAVVRLLKSATGKNFSDYVGELRVRHAEELLTSTDMSVTEIAVNSGFDSSNSLYKAFKKVFGVSPSAYRESRNKKLTDNTV